MVLAKDDYVVLTCMCCMDVRSQKKLLDIQLNYRDGSTMTLIYSCPSCGKQSTAGYKLFSGGPLNRKDGYKLKGYLKIKKA